MKSGEGRLEIVARSGEDKSVSEYSFERVKEGTQTFQVYTVSTVNPLNENETFYSVYKVWIKDGLVFKTNDATSVNDAKNIESISVATYDYKPKKFTIAAPVLPKKRKS
jgi:hypothetical protein